jgi:hypothetical protein
MKRKLAGLACYPHTVNHNRGERLSRENQDWDEVSGGLPLPTKLKFKRRCEL